MPQANETENTAPNVQDKRKPAPGVLPKNAQSWVVIGLTAVIMLLLWVSGPAHDAKATKNSEAMKAETVSGLSPADIAARLDQERQEQEDPGDARAQRPRRGQVEGSLIGDLGLLRAVAVFAARSSRGPSAPIGEKKGGTVSRRIWPRKRLIMTLKAAGL